MDGHHAVSDGPAVHGYQKSGQLARRHRQRPREVDGPAGGAALGFTPDGLVNPAAFAHNDPGTFGNVGRGAFYGPSLHTWDMGLFKNFRVSSDVQFRAEFFNIFNQVNFDIPNTNVSGGNFGSITRTDPSFGDPLILQFGLKFVF